MIERIEGDSMIKLYYDCCGKECKELEENPFAYFWEVQQLERLTKQCFECARKEAIKFYGLENIVKS